MSEPAQDQRTDAQRVLDAFFIDNRAKVLDIAAFMDRFERARRTPGDDDDHRWQAIVQALEILTDGSPARARRILELWSDPTAEPVEKADAKGATGAWPGLARKHDLRP